MLMVSSMVWHCPQMKADSDHFILIMIASFHIKGYAEYAAKTGETVLLSKWNPNVLPGYNIIHYNDVIYMMFCCRHTPTDSMSGILSCFVFSLSLTLGLSEHLWLMNNSKYKLPFAWIFFFFVGCVGQFQFMENI